MLWQKACKNNQKTSLCLTTLFCAMYNKRIEMKGITDMYAFVNAHAYCCYYAYYMG